MFMSKNSLHQETLPQPAIEALCQLGDNLKVARLKREITLQEWAKRMNVSIPTLVRMERGDPSVGVGVYVTAMWLVDALESLKNTASPESDKVAITLETHRARKRGTRV